MQHFLKEYLEVHGYWVLFVWTFLEGEAGLILAGLLAFEGDLNLFGVVVTAFGGAFCGDQFYFYLGRLKGKYLLRHSHALVRKLRKGLRLIERYGSLVAFTSRYTYGFRIVLPIVLGMTPFPALRFLWLNLASASVWAVVFSLAGYLFGKSATLVVGDVKKYKHILVFILAGLIAAIWTFHFLQARRRSRPARLRLKRLREYRIAAKVTND